MAARLSTKQLTDSAVLAQRAERLRERVAPLARADAAAYGLVLAARRTPNTDDRDGRVRAALSEAADVPLAVAEAGAEVAVIAARLASDGNPNLKGDAICALMLVDAGVRAAATLVEINVSDGRIEDGRLGRARQLVEAAASARRSVEGEV
jgi:formiminotetrahydrofolate cyclodeaminase